MDKINSIRLDVAKKFEEIIQKLKSNRLSSGAMVSVGKEGEEKFKKGDILISRKELNRDIEEMRYLIMKLCFCDDEGIDDIFDDLEDMGGLSHL